MERLRERLQVASNALTRFEEVLSVANPDAFIRDASLQRFEFTFEALWKAAKTFLVVREGIEVASPKAVIRACREVGLLSDTDTMLALTMADDRNLTVHTYNEPLAIEIYERLRDYCSLMKRWLLTMKDTIE